MKKILMLFWVMTFIITVCGCSVVKLDRPSPDEKPDKVALESGAWKKAFGEFLLDLNGKNQEDYEVINYVSLNDLNLDGVPELIVSDDGASAACSFAIFQLIDEKVEKVWGYSSLFEGGPQQSEDGEFVNFYSVFDDDFLTLCKNRETGELAYVMETENGNSEGSFESIFLLTEVDGKIVPVERFFYEDRSDLAEKEKADSYYVDKKPVTEKEYEKAYDRFEKLWKETDYHGPAMASEHLGEQPDAVKLEMTPEGLDRFFGKYAPEVK